MHHGFSGLWADASSADGEIGAAVSLKDEGTPFAPPGLPEIQGAVASITAEERVQLTQFAKRRLEHFGINPGEPSDLYQQAIYAVLHGWAKKRGRKPNASDLAHRGAFQNYLRGVINSVAEGWARRHHRVTRITFPLHSFEPVLVSPWNTWKQLEFADLQTALFSHLREDAPARLMPTIDAWQKAPDERIPCVTSRKHVAAVRRLAQRIAPRLGLTRPRVSRRPALDSRR